ncbi:hypothetical protein ACPCSE_29300 [Streptomyces cellulosae]
MSTTPTTAADCPNNPLGHAFNGGTRCAYCPETRTAREAVTSILAGGMRGGIGQEAAEALVSQVIAEARRGGAPKPTVRPVR